MTKWSASYNGATHNVTISNDASVATFPTPLREAGGTGGS